MNTTQRSHLQRLRERAETALNHISSSSDVDTSNVAQLIEELKVYHVELELQNEELQDAHRRLEIARQEYEHLFNVAPLAYVVIDKRGIIHKANYTATRQFGISRERLEGRTLMTIVAPESQDDFHLHLRQVVRTRKRQTHELSFVKHNGSRFYALIESVPEISDSAVQTIRSAITDISQRKIYEQRLQGLRQLDQATLRLQSISEIIEVALCYLLTLTRSARASILIFDSDHHFVDVFSQSVDKTNVIAERKPWDDILPSLIPAVPQVIHSSAGNVEAILSIPIFQHETQIGSIWLHAVTANAFDDDVMQAGQETALQLGIAVQHITLVQQVQHYAEELESRVEARTRELHEREQSEHLQRIFAEAMLDIARGLNSTLDLDQVLERILMNLGRVMPYDMANIMLLQDTTGRTVKWHGKGLGHDDNVTDDVIEIDVNTHPAYQKILQNGECLLMNGLEQITGQTFAGTGGQSYTYIGVPIRSDEQIHGIINIYCPQMVSFSKRQIEHLEAFADHAAVAINNARLHKKEQELAVVEERQRLARDLHDAVSQMLFALSLTAEAVAAAKNRNSERQKNNLADIARLAQAALSEMRLLLFELRPTDGENIQLKELLEKLVSAFRGRDRRSIQLTVDGNLPVLPIEIKVQLYRIAQEAMNNASKHTEVSPVELHLQVVEHELILVIQDHGPGFDVRAVQGDGHGLLIMQERAAKIGAKLAITSEIGVGTQVKLSLPLESC